MQLQHNLAAELASAALIRLCGISVAVAKNHTASFERRCDHFSNRLRPIRKHQPKLSSCGKIFRARIKKQLADTVTDTSAARLTGDDDLLAARFQPCGQLAHLRGLAGTIQPFEREKKTTAHGASVAERGE